MGILPAEPAVKEEGHCELLYSHSLSSSFSLSINVCNHILERQCDFKVHLFHAAQTLIIPTVISKIIKYWLTHHSTLCRVMILPEDLEQFLKADVFWLIDYSYNLGVTSSAFKDKIKAAVTSENELEHTWCFVLRSKPSSFLFFLLLHLASSGHSDFQSFTLKTLTS